jgi:putative FmdB family regulatory protein
MPTYDYACASCGHEDEIFESFSAAATKTCPRCRRRRFQRRLGTGGGLLFKGSGFYTTDYRSESYKAAAKSDAPAACAGNPASCSQPACPGAS